LICLPVFLRALAYYSLVEGIDIQCVEDGNGIAVYRVVDIVDVRATSPDNPQ